jgi:hypothetical protein
MKLDVIVRLDEDRDDWTTSLDLAPAATPQQVRGLHARVRWYVAQLGHILDFFQEAIHAAQDETTESLIRGLLAPLSDLFEDSADLDTLAAILPRVFGGYELLLATGAADVGEEVVDVHSRVRELCRSSDVLSGMVDQVESVRPRDWVCCTDG